MSNDELMEQFSASNMVRTLYQKPDYDYIHCEMAKIGVTLILLWLEYCDQCRESGFIPYKHTQFYKYYQDFVHETI